MGVRAEGTERMGAARAQVNEMRHASELWEPTLVTMRFHDFFCRLPVFSTLRKRSGRSLHVSSVLAREGGGGMSGLQRHRAKNSGGQGGGGLKRNSVPQHNAIPHPESSALTHLNISCSATGRTLGNGTSHFPAFSFLFCLMVLLNTLARSTCN